MITLNGMTLGLHVRRRALLITLLIVSVAVNLAWTAAGRAQVGHPIPTLATYLIDYERSSWLVTAADSHLMDRPLIGAYSSDDETVMRQHMYWAQQAGLGGFMVEWRNERKLNIRLERLAVLAKETEFALSIAYRAENQTRKQIDQDLEALQRIVAPHEIFYPKPRPYLLLVDAPRRRPALLGQQLDAWRAQFTILVAEVDAERYRQWAPFVDGNALWSSTDPPPSNGAAPAISELRSQVQSLGGIWAGSASGAIQESDVDAAGRLRRSLDSALQSMPDLIVLQSWNDFRSGTHLEPSRGRGTMYLDALTDIAVTEAPQPIDFDSDSPAVTVLDGGMDETLSSTALFSYLFSNNLAEVIGRFISLILLALLLFVGFAITVIRSVRLSMRRKRTVHQP